MTQNEQLKKWLSEVEKELEERKAELQQVTAERESWDFKTPEEALKKLNDLMRVSWSKSTRAKMPERFRMISGAFSVWSSIYRLSTETEQLQELKQAVEEIRKKIEQDSGQPLRLEK